MNEILFKLNIICDDEDLIGKVRNIIQAYYELIKYDIENVEDFEEKFNSIREKYEFLEILIKDLEKKQVLNSDIIRVKYNPMGAFYYEII